MGSPDDGPEIFLAGEVQDDLLRMLFICCDEAIPVESQLVLALKTLCGFGVREIALRLFTSEANVYKRLGRARGHLRKRSPRFEELTGEQRSSRLPAVHKILYLVFTEGYLSCHAEMAIRRELCNEAIRLATILAEHPADQAPETFALLALMHLHTARMTARQDGSGGLLLLEEQDRQLGTRMKSSSAWSGWRDPRTAMSFPGTTPRPGSRRNTASPHRFTRLAGTRWSSVTRCSSGSPTRQYTR